jgi:hypothetical protein
VPAIVIQPHDRADLRRIGSALLISQSGQMRPLRASPGTVPRRVRLRWVCAPWFEHRTFFSSVRDSSPVIAVQHPAAARTEASCSPRLLRFRRTAQGVLQRDLNTWGESSAANVEGNAP